MDEACASRTVQLESQPEAIDVLQRKKMQLEVEIQALKKETEASSKSRRTKARHAAATL